MSIDQNFKAYKRDSLKVMYRIKLDNENYYNERRIITKILKWFCNDKTNANRL